MLSSDFVGLESMGMFILGLGPGLPVDIVVESEVLGVFNNQCCVVVLDNFLASVA